MKARGNRGRTVTMVASTRVLRDVAAGLGHEALRIIEAGSYTASDGTHVDIRAALEAAVAGTVSYPPNQRTPSPATGRHSCHFRVENTSTLAAACALAAEGLNPAALNFASATHPGGGFLTGARAQEESLCWSSGLYACLRDNPMYALHRENDDPLYSNYVIYSPGVPVFRGDDTRLLTTPYLLAFITASAPNTRRMGPGRRSASVQALRERVRKVLAVGLVHGHDALVLGAWGCGTFGNDPRTVSLLFCDALSGEFKGAFRAVMFAVLDWSADRRFIEPFEAALRSRLLSNA